jgi:hypothetical protein
MRVKATFIIWLAVVGVGLICMISVGLLHQ